MAPNVPLRRSSRFQPLVDDHNTQQRRDRSEPVGSDVTLVDHPSTQRHRERSESIGSCIVVDCPARPANESAASRAEEVDPYGPDITEAGAVAGQPEVELYYIRIDTHYTVPKYRVQPWVSNGHRTRWPDLGDATEFKLGEETFKVRDYVQINLAQSKAGNNVARIVDIKAVTDSKWYIDAKTYQAQTSGSLTRRPYSSHVLLTKALPDKEIVVLVMWLYLLEDEQGVKKYFHSSHVQAVSRHTILSHISNQRHNGIDRGKFYEDGNGRFLPADGPEAWQWAHAVGKIMYHYR